MAAPHDRDVSLLQFRDQAGRLRVVQENDVPGSNHRRQLLSDQRERPRVLAVLGLAQVATVSLEALDLVVNSLRHLEKLGAALDHDPAGVDAST